MAHPNGASSGKFTVVEFPEEQDESGSIPMDIIGSSWIFEKNGQSFCFWPKYLKTIKEKTQAIENEIGLQINNCSICEVTVKYVAKTYEKACEKLELLKQETSVSQSSSESESSDGPKAKRRKIKRTYDTTNFEYFSENDEYIPDAPEITPKNSSNERTLKNASKNSFKNGQSQSRRKLFSTVEVDSTRTRAETPISISLSTTNCQPQKQHDGVPTKSRVDTILRSETSSSTGRSTPKCNCCNENEVVLRQLCTKVEELVKLNKYLVQITQTQSANLNVSLMTGDSTTLNNLPLHTEQDVLKFDTSLEENSIFMELCAAFQIVGGKDTVDTSRRIMSRIISNSLAIKMNWSGRNLKIGFSKFKNILKLITAAVRNNPFSRNATQKEIESVIKIWLRNAGDREGGRSRRMRNTDENTANNRDDADEVQ